MHDEAIDEAYPRDLTRHTRISRLLADAKQPCSIHLNPDVIIGRSVGLPVQSSVLIFTITSPFKLQELVNLDKIRTLLNCINGSEQT